MQKVAIIIKKNPDANRTFKIAEAVLLSSTFHNTHESPKGFCKNEGALMITNTQRRAKTHLPEMQLKVKEGSGLKYEERSL